MMTSDVFSAMSLTKLAEVMPKYSLKILLLTPLVLNKCRFRAEFVLERTTDIPNVSFHFTAYPLCGSGLTFLLDVIRHIIRAKIKISHHCVLRNKSNHGCVRSACIW